MQFIKTIRAHAHCDVPCGIYDPTEAKIAAKTVARMTDQLIELDAPESAGDSAAMRHYLNDAARRIATKEEHAERCKNQLEILWSDFFKEEHLKDVPDLHEKFWKAVKLCSKTKQEIDADAAGKLVGAVDDIAEAFYRVKGVPERLNAYKEVTDNLY